MISIELRCWRSCVLVVVLCCLLVPAIDGNPAAAESLQQLPLAGRNGDIAADSVVRVVCLQTRRGGSGFLHKSGRIITAAHVIADCPISSLLVQTSNAQTIKVASEVHDELLDLALLVLATPIKQRTLAISASSKVSIGQLVSTWGFPEGHGGQFPLLTVGYLAGFTRVSLKPKGQTVDRWVVNAAFNSGNSGGPVIDIDSGLVFGVVSAKLAPIPAFIEQGLDALSRQKSGFIYNVTHPDGSKESLTEGRLVAHVLTYLRSQTQLVIGYAVTFTQLRDFLLKNKIEP